MRKTLVQGNILEIVQSAEQGNLAEFGYSGDEYKLNIGICVLDHGIKVFEFLTNSNGKRRVFNAVQNRLVIFIHQHHYPATAVFIKRPDQFVKAPLAAFFVIFNAKIPAVIIQNFITGLLKFFHTSDHTGPKTDVNHRIALTPVPIVIQKKALE